MKCKQCSSCCKEVRFPVPETPISIEYFKARGIKFENSWVSIPHECKQLKDNKCMIHKTKPFVCLKFPFNMKGDVESILLPEGCAYR